MGYNAATKPAGWIDLTPSKRFALFERDAVATFTFSTAGPTGGTYTVRHVITGAVVASGSIAGLTSLNVPTTTCGPYVLHLDGTASDAVYDTAIGEAFFAVFGA
ncbi:MAG: hypothetical protein M3404_05130 [Actinomycetota bacterium]|nr:hypothetical protein [Actinomycetota bacterium]